MSAALTLLALGVMGWLVLRQLQANHARRATTPWAAPLGADTAGDRDAQRVRDDVRAVGDLTPSRPRDVRPARSIHPRRPVGAPRAA